MELIEEVVVPAREGRVVAVSAGQVLEVVDREGHQVGDLVAWRPDAPSEYLSPAHTCSCLTKLVPEVATNGSPTTARRCCRCCATTWATTTSSCPAAIRSATPATTASPTTRRASGRCRRRWPPRTRRGPCAPSWRSTSSWTTGWRMVGSSRTRARHPAGSTIALRALVDLKVALSACPQDLSPCNDWNPTSMALRVLAGEE